jgi:hypothetical protein
MNSSGCAAARFQVTYQPARIWLVSLGGCPRDSVFYIRILEPVRAWRNMSKDRVTRNDRKMFPLVLDFLFGRCDFDTASFTRTISVNQPREIVCLERIRLGRLLARGVQGQVHAAVVG